MRSIVAFFALALLFTFCYCATQFTATGVIYCPSKDEWEYKVELWEGKNYIGGGKVLDTKKGKGNDQVVFYELVGDTVLTNFPVGHLAIEINHSCKNAKNKFQIWPGYSMYVPLDSDKAYGFGAHNLGKNDETGGYFQEDRFN
ncbi:hypothetical protein CAEBREN_08561 [Caenorhabditis brenneri]|uniref:Uncharacterized protein n=1 Tax=Caenorhabditis brenneri TaxID=135651 RepID=G0NBW5_CAEBE|nr:hypothetical protein CAEBREN_08561 [Caenorhabditis brenneri]